MRSLNLAIKNLSIEEMFKEYDLNNNNSITKESFIKVMEKHSNLIEWFADTYKQT